MGIFEYNVIFFNLIEYYMSCIKYYNKVSIQNVTGTREFTVYTATMMFFCLSKLYKNGAKSSLCAHFFCSRPPTIYVNLDISHKVCSHFKLILIPLPTSFSYSTNLN